MGNDGLYSIWFGGLFFSAFVVSCKKDQEDQEGTRKAPNGILQYWLNQT